MYRDRFSSLPFTTQKVLLPSFSMKGKFPLQYVEIRGVNEPSFVMLGLGSCNIWWARARIELKRLGLSNFAEARAQLEMLGSRATDAAHEVYVRAGLLIYKGYICFQLP